MSSHSDPSVVARDYLEALADLDWQRAAGYVNREFIDRVLKPFLPPAGPMEPHHGRDPDSTHESPLAQFFSGVGSAIELASLPPRVAFARCLASWASDDRHGTSPRRVERVIGSVSDRDTAHVVYYARWEGEPTAVPRVLLLKHDAGGWTVLPTTEALQPPETIFGEPFSYDW